MIKSAPPHISPPVFQGARATQAAQQTRTYREEDLQALVRQDSDPYIGSLPSALLDSTGLSRAELTKILDRTARKILRSKLAYEPNPANGSTFAIDNQRAFGIQTLHPTPWQRLRERLKPQESRTQPLVLMYLNSGCLAHAFVLAHGSQHYVLKVSRFIHGDIGNGAYFTALGTSDIPQFHIGNPKGHWALMELLRPTMKVEGRAGKPLSEHGFCLNDDRQANHVGPFTVDLDQVVPSSSKPPRRPKAR